MRACGPCTRAPSPFTVTAGAHPRGGRLTTDSLTSTPTPIAIGMAVSLALAISSLLKKLAEKKAMDGGPSRRTRSKTK